MYVVGQILFVVLRKEATVYPMQCVEEITKKTLNGEITTYMVRGQDASKPLAISEIDGEVFDSAERAKKVLIERVSASISHRVDQAMEKAKEWYPAGFEQAQDDPMSLIKKTVTVSEQQQPKPKRQSSPPRAELAELAAELTAESEQAMMELPDGTKAKIRSVKVPPSMQD
jgi:hypothetical protein